jgi:hypothetical protein
MPYPSKPAVVMVKSDPASERFKTKSVHLREWDSPETTMSCDDDGIDVGITITSAPGCEKHGLLVQPGVVCI